MQRGRTLGRKLSTNDQQRGKGEKCGNGAAVANSSNLFMLKRVGGKGGKANAKKPLEKRLHKGRYGYASNTYEDMPPLSSYEGESPIDGVDELVMNTLFVKTEVVITGDDVDEAPRSSYSYESTGVRTITGAGEDKVSDPVVSLQVDAPSSSQHNPALEEVILAHDPEAESVEAMTVIQVAAESPRAFHWPGRYS